MVALGAAALILVVGFTYTAQRSRTYHSEAKLILEPRAHSPSQVAVAITALEGATTLGTYVELLSVRGFSERKRFPGVHLNVRALVDPGGGSSAKTRIIKIIASSRARNTVQPALRVRIAAAELRLPMLRDLWRFKVVQAPTLATETPPSTRSLLVATVLLSALGALMVMALHLPSEAQSSTTSRLRSRFANRPRHSPRTG